MNIPTSLKYSAQHLWTSTEPDGTLRCGITDHAQETLGDIVFIEPPATGSMLRGGQPCGIVESVKTASDLHAPVSGEVVDINAALQSAPESVNEDPYRAWIFRLRPTAPEELAHLMDATGYRALLDQ